MKGDGLLNVYMFIHTHTYACLHIREQIGETTMRPKSIG